MKKRLVIIFLIAIPVIFFAIKLNNYFVGKNILGDTDINLSYLKIVPKRREIDKNIAFPHSMLYTLGNIQFKVPRNDTLITYKVKKNYKSFKFQNNAHLLIFKDTIPFNFFQQLALVKPADSSILKNFNNQNKLTSSFELLLYAYRKVPNDISFFNLSTKNAIIQYTFLKFKIMNLGIGSDKGFYFFTLKNIKGFQFGKPGMSNKTFINFFTKNDDDYMIYTSGLKQAELDYIINSIDYSSLN